MRMTIPDRHTHKYMYPFPHKRHTRTTQYHSKLAATILNCTPLQLLQSEIDNSGNLFTTLLPTVNNVRKSLLCSFDSVGKRCLLHHTNWKWFLIGRPIFRSMAVGRQCIGIVTKIASIAGESPQ